MSGRVESHVRYRSFSIPRFDTTVNASFLSVEYTFLDSDTWQRIFPDDTDA